MKKYLNELVKTRLKSFLNYFLIVVGMCVCFTVGYYFNVIKKYTTKSRPEQIFRNDVTIAIDERSNFMIIRKNDGSYTLFEDSIGYAIFDIYAKNIWCKNDKPK